MEEKVTIRSTFNPGLVLTGLQTIEFLSERTVSDGGNLCPLLSVILNSV